LKLWWKKIFKTEDHNVKHKENLILIYLFFLVLILFIFSPFVLERRDKLAEKRWKREIYRLIIFQQQRKLILISIGSIRWQKYHWAIFRTSSCWKSRSKLREICFPIWLCFWMNLRVFWVKRLVYWLQLNFLI
jgi:hypothetical protein